MTRIVLVIVGMTGHLNGRAASTKEHEKEVVNVLSTAKRQFGRDLVLLPHVRTNVGSNQDHDNGVKAKDEDPSQDWDPKESKYKNHAEQDAVVAQRRLLPGTGLAVPGQSHTIDDLRHENRSANETHPPGGLRKDIAATAQRGAPSTNGSPILVCPHGLGVVVAVSSVHR